jgi:hypothetical protein
MSEISNQVQAKQEQAKQKKKHTKKGSFGEGKMGGLLMDDNDDDVTLEE